jgi:hypothetical protein
MDSSLGSKEIFVRSKTSMVLWSNRRYIREKLMSWDFGYNFIRTLSELSKAARCKALKESVPKKNFKILTTL